VSAIRPPRGFCPRRRAPALTRGCKRIGNASASVPGCRASGCTTLGTRSPHSRSRTGIRCSSSGKRLATSKRALLRFTRTSAMIRCDRSRTGQRRGLTRPSRGSRPSRVLTWCHCEGEPGAASASASNSRCEVDEPRLNRASIRDQGMEEHAANFDAACVLIVHAFQGELLHLGFGSARDVAQAGRGLTSQVSEELHAPDWHWWGGGGHEALLSGGCVPIFGPPAVSMASAPAVVMLGPGLVALWSHRKLRISAAGHVVTYFLHSPAATPCPQQFYKEKVWATGPVSRINGLERDQSVTGPGPDPDRKHCCAGGPRAKPLQVKTQLLGRPRACSIAPARSRASHRAA